MLNIRRAQLFDASASIARRGRSLSATDVLSTSVTSRLSGGSRRSCLRKLKDIFCRVLVAVVMCSALHAIELPHVERHRLVDVPARRTPLGRREEAVGNADFFSIPACLVFKHPAKLAEAGACDVLGELPVSDHPAHVQILDGDHIELADESRRELIERVLTAVRDVRLMSRHLHLLRPPAVASLDATGENPLQLSELDRVLRRVSRVGDSFPRTQRRQSRDSQVDPDLPARLGERVLGLVEAKRHEILPVAVLGNRHCGWSARELAAPLDVKATDFGNCEVAVARIPFERIGSVLGGLLAVFGAETRIFGSLGEEVGERRLQMPQCLLLRRAGRLAQPRELGVLSVFRPRRAARAVVYRSARLEAVGAQPEREIEGMPRTAELPRQLPRLAVCWVETECLPCLHTTTM